MTENANCFREKKETYFERISQMKEGCKVFCVKILIYIRKLLRDRYLFEILHTSSSLRLGKNVVKSRSF